MSEQIKVSDPLIIAAHLEDNIAGKFVRATVKDSSGVEIVGSPVSLTDLGAGVYLDQTLIKKRGTFMAIIEVFDDAGFTLPNQDFEVGVETFIDPPFSVLFDPGIDVEIGDNPVLDVEIIPGDTIDIELEQPIIEVDIDCD